MANLLASMTAAELATLLNARGVAPEATWHDVFDAADALLTPESTRAALAAVPRRHAIALRSAALTHAPVNGETAKLTFGLALADAHGALFEVVQGLAASAEFAVPEETRPAAAATAIDETAAAHAAELAFLTVARVADLVLTASERPLATLHSGGLRSTERKRLVEAGLDLEAETLDLLAALARAGGLLAASDAAAHVSSTGTAWLEEPFPTRWARLAARVLAELPEELTPTPPARWATAYPWNSQWPERANDIVAEFVALGLLDAQTHWTPWGRALLAGDDSAATSALADFVPHEVDRVFVQHDYTIIAPGPLEPRYDLALRRFSDAAPGGHASGYRLSADSVTRALTAGMTSDDMLSLLREISLSGTPQPVEYLIRNAANRHGAVRVGAHPETGATVVTSHDEQLLERLAADRELRMLSLRSESPGLTTPVSPQNTHWALLEAGYPSLLSANCTVAVAAPAEVDETAPDYTKLIALIARTSTEDSAEAWLNRELELAARERGTLIIEVAMPDGSARELTLQVNAFSGGRLRGLDRSAEVERTVPVSSIRSARPV